LNVGFSISGPYDGGAIHARGTSLTLRACEIVSNWSRNAGAGIYVWDNGTSIIEDCLFADNIVDSVPSALSSGAIDNNGSVMTLTRCTFSGNQSHLGGAVGVYGGSEALITDCIFSRNVATVASLSRGGAVVNATSFLSIRGTSFEGNAAPGGTGGAIYNLTLGSDVHGYLDVSDCRFVANSANGSGGAIYADPPYEGTAGAGRCLFAGNSSGQAGGAVYGACALTDSIIVGNTADSSGGVSASEIVSDCLLVDNHATGTGGGAGMAGALLYGCLIVGNVAGTDGGGVFVEGAYGATTLANCAIAGNSAGRYGGGAYHQGSDATLLRNCTGLGNVAANAGGGFYNYSYHPAIKSWIFWGNRDAGGTDQTAQADCRTGYDPVVTYCCIQNYTGHETTNIKSDPQLRPGLSGTWTVAPIYDSNAAQTIFTDSSQAWETNTLAASLLNPNTDQMRQSIVAGNTATQITVWGDFSALGVIGTHYQITDFHLAVASPCIDIGDRYFALAPGQVADIDGQFRLWDGNGDGQKRVDMGADEFGAPLMADLNCDGEVDGFDIEPFFLALESPDLYQIRFPACDYRLADANEDGAADGFDIEPFFYRLETGR
jgi:predicted outer membrane repeat protein